MKLAFVTYHLPPDALGGAERYAISLGSWLNERGNEVEVFGAATKLRYQTMGHHGITLRKLPVLRQHRYYSYFASLWGTLRAESPLFSIVQGFGITHLSGFVVSACKGKLPVVLRVEGELEPHICALSDTKIMALPAWCERTMKQADHFVVVSKCSVDELSNWGIHPQRITYLPNAIDTDYWVPASQGKRDVRRSLQLHDNAFYAACVARLRPEKGHRTALNAWRLVVNQTPDARLLVIGDGPEESDLRKLVRDLSLSDNVLFLGHKDNVREYLQAADVSLLFSSAEGPAISVQESLACGIPVIATAVGGLKDSVIPNETGILVRPGDPESAATSILQYMNDKHLGSKLARGAREFAVRNRSHKVLASCYEALFKEVIERWEKETGKRLAGR
ncbi:MAG TPA: glycosyltransferase family 4 protein [Candidatus Aquicultor sp.]